jgi:hypothetical protein
VGVPRMRLLRGRRRDGGALLAAPSVSNTSCGSRLQRPKFIAVPHSSHSTNHAGLFDTSTRVSSAAPCIAAFSRKAVPAVRTPAARSGPLIVKLYGRVAGRNAINSPRL